jgi:hypothetical protein
MKYLFGEDYEQERVDREKARLNPSTLSSDSESEENATPKFSKGKRKRTVDDDDGSEEEVKRLVKKARKLPRSAKGKGRAKAQMSEDEDDGDDGHDAYEDDDNGASSSRSPASKLINRPKRQKPQSKKDDSGPSWQGSGPPVLLAKKWDLEDGIEPTGWWVSEKLDGVR